MKQKRFASGGFVPGIDKIDNPILSAFLTKKIYYHLGRNGFMEERFFLKHPN